VAFKTLRESASPGSTNVISEQTFSSGVPSPGEESVVIDLYAYGNSPIPVLNPAEVTIEKFEYLP
jgi:hypothetical protein